MAEANTSGRGALSFLEALRRGGLVFDGAMGTALYERGLLYSSCLDAAVLQRPDLVIEVHESFARVGVQAIQTNSFGANRLRLAPHGLQERVVEINRRSVELARQAAKESAFVIGSVGPSGLLLRSVQREEQQSLPDVFAEQCQALCDAGVDALMLETFRQPEEVKLAIEAARRASGGKVPVCVSVSFDAFGTMADGTQPESMAQKLVEWGADAIGVNCSDGPTGVYETTTRMLHVGVPVVARPNAGLPQRVEGRLAYVATPEYFQLYARRLYKAGVHAVGGCCGTTPEHIKKVIAAARMASASRSSEPPDAAVQSLSQPPPSPAPGIRVVPLQEKGVLGAMLGRKFVVSVEVNPPPGLDLRPALQAARLLRDGGVDVINVADGPRASARMGNLALCARIQQQLGMPTLMHVTTRDRNLLGLVAHLLAAYELEVRNLVIITGDPPKMGNFADATPVYDLDSIGLLRVVRDLNHGVDPGGKPTGAPTDFLCATGAEPAAHDYDRELRRLAQKCEAGAELIMTQPVYDPAVLQRFLGDVGAWGVPVLVGLLPLASHRNAEFLHHEVPGMQIPEAIRERMKRVGSGPGARAEGVKIAREMLLAVRQDVAGAYIMPPLGRYEMALEILDGMLDKPAAEALLA